MRTIQTIVTLAVVLVGAPLASAQSVVKVTGSTTINAILFQPHKSDIEKGAGVSIEVIGNSSSRGLTDLVGGRSDIAMISSPLAEIAQKVNEKTPGAVDASGLREFKIGESRLVFIVHPTNPVKSLTLAQLRDVFAGKVTNWKELGGADAPIAVVTEGPGNGMRTTIEDKIMGGVPFTSQARVVVNAPQMPVIVKQLPSAIAFATPKVAEGSGVTIVKTDKPIVQSLFLVTKGAPSPTLTKVVEAATTAAH